MFWEQYMFYFNNKTWSGLKENRQVMGEKKI